jgi:hypothetical protein
MSFKKLAQVFLGYSIAAIFSVAALVAPAQAHELRNLGNNYWIQAGWDVEPAVKNSANALDVFAFWWDGDPTHLDPTHPEWFHLLDTTAGDTVKLAAVGLRLESENYNAEVEEIFGVPGPFTQFIGDDGLGYVSGSITPHHAGAYGFIITGKLQRVGYQPKIFLQKFVCGAGSQDTTYGTDFVCVTNP